MSHPFLLASRRSRPALLAGEYDLRGVRGNEPGVDARFRKVTLAGTFDGPLSQEELDCIAEQVGGSLQGGSRQPGSGALDNRQTALLLLLRAVAF